MKFSFRCETDDGHVLEFTDADAVVMDLSTPWDVVDISEDGATVVTRKLTTPHVKFDAIFDPERPPRWTRPDGA